jgi:hypothetical protein
MDLINMQGIGLIEVSEQLREQYRNQNANNHSEHF